MGVGETTARSRRLRRVEWVPPSADVKHFDELDHDRQRRFLALLEGEDVEPRFSADVVVFTDYYAVVDR